MHGQAKRARLFHRLGMDAPYVTVEDDVAHALLGDQTAERLAPLIGLAAEGDVASGMKPEGAVARIEAHAPDLGPGLAQHRAKPVEEGAVRALQE